MTYTNQKKINKMIEYIILVIAVFLAVLLVWLIKILFYIDKNLEEILVTLQADTNYMIDKLDHLNKTPYKHSKNR